MWPLGKALAHAILHFIPPDEPVLVPIDDTTGQPEVKLSGEVKKSPTSSVLRR